jgi:hypothetical protein
MKATELKPGAIKDAIFVSETAYSCQVIMWRKKTRRE